MSFKVLLFVLIYSCSLFSQVNKSLLNDTSNMSSSLNNFNKAIVPITVVQKPLPPSTINGPLLICPGVPTAYSASPLAGSTTHWQVTNGTIIGSAIGNNVSIVFNTNVAGPYQVSVWYETQFCATDLYSISVDREPVDLALIQTQSPVCASSFATYSVADFNADSYNWTIVPQSAGSISAGQNTNEVSILWNQYSGNAHIKIEVVKCKTTYLVQHLIQVIMAPNVTIVANADTCTGVNSNFTLALTPNSTFNYVVWDFGDGITQTVNYTNPSSLSITHQYNDPLTTSTNYQVTATIHGAGGCIMPAVATFAVTVSPSPIIYLTPTEELDLCDPLLTPASYVYNVNIQNGFASSNSFQWFQNGSAIAGQTAATINVQSLGEGSYYAVVTNSFNCSATTQAPM